MTQPEPTSTGQGDTTLRQKVEGDRNQVIGQMFGGIVINQLTIHDRVPAAALPPVSVAPSLTQQEYRQRQVLLNKVKEYWVQGVLETSLHTRALIELGLQDRSDLVQHPFREVAEFPEVSGQALTEGTSATTVFEQMGIGRTLLILGEPGSGKTITLLKLAEDLIARTEKDLSQPIPVVFNLSSWARKPQQIEQWLVQELLEKYQVSKALGKQWVETEGLILLLDGLDEVKAEQRNGCVQALNQFMQAHGTTELTICCRINDYQALTERLMLRSAVCIQALTAEQVHSYFEQVGAQLKALKTVLQQDQELQGLTTSPLMLSIMSLAYQDCAVADVPQGGTITDYRQRLFDTYVDRMFQRHGNTQHYPRLQTQRWLIWLAQCMTVASQTVFLIEQLQPSWLPTRWQRLQYRLETSLISLLSVGLINGLAVALAFGPITNLSESELLRRPRSAIFSILVQWLGFGLIGFLPGDIKPVEALKWSWRATIRGFRDGLILGLTGGLFLGLLSGLLVMLINGQTPLHVGVLVIGLFLGLGYGLLGGLMGVLIGGFRGGGIQRTGKSNQGIFRSARNAVILGILGWLVWGLFFKLLGPLVGVLTGWLGYGLIAGLLGGGSACIRHIALRYRLYCLGYSPWNYARFLDYCIDRLFLQKVGGGYIFVHRMLLEHFAAMSLEQGGH